MRSTAILVQSLRVRRVCRDSGSSRHRAGIAALRGAECTWCRVYRAPAGSRRRCAHFMRVLTRQGGMCPRAIGLTYGAGVEVRRDLKDGWGCSAAVLAPAGALRSLLKLRASTIRFFGSEYAFIPVRCRIAITPATIHKLEIFSTNYSSSTYPKRWRGIFCLTK